MQKTRLNKNLNIRRIFMADYRICAGHADKNIYIYIQIKKGHKVL